MTAALLLTKKMIQQWFYNVVFIRRQAYVNALLLGLIGVLFQQRIIAQFFPRIEHTLLLYGMSFILIYTAYIWPVWKSPVVFIPLYFSIVFLFFKTEWRGILISGCILGILFISYQGFKLGILKTPGWRNYVFAKPLIVVSSWIGLVYGIPFSISVAGIERLYDWRIISDVLLVLSLSLLADVQDHKHDCTQKLTTVSTRFGQKQVMIFIGSILLLRCVGTTLVGNYAESLSAWITCLLFYLIFLFQKRTDHFDKLFSDGLLLIEVTCYWLLATQIL